MSAPTVRSGRVLNTRSAAEFSGMAYQTFRNLLAAGNGPKVFKQGRLNAFYEVDLDAWLKSRVVDPAAETAESAA